MDLSDYAMIGGGLLVCLFLVTGLWPSKKERQSGHRADMSRLMAEARRRNEMTRTAGFGPTPTLGIRPTGSLRDQRANQQAATFSRVYGNRDPEPRSHDDGFVTGALVGAALSSPSHHSSPASSCSDSGSSSFSSSDSGCSDSGGCSGGGCD